MISKEDILKGLETEVFAKKVFTFDTIDSTNDCAKVLATNNQPAGSLIISEYQTKGHGRFKRQWLSEPGKNLLFSLILKPDLDERYHHLLTFFIANCIADVIETLYKIKVMAKWPNDLLINERKFCGILLETVKKDDIFAIICGVGINVNQTVFHENLINVTSLKREIHNEVDRLLLLKSILKKLDSNYKHFIENPKNEIELWKERDILKGKSVHVFFNQNNYFGHVIDIDSDGYLVLRTDGKKRLKFYSGDVSLKSKE
ncbi:MAG TPA: biotin--[acetyl-CoA-carboxylase] ligase [Ignavibacteria bacterium]|jgi:BirA family biotin operon repressor/biotin-[acetyl-CoA-carboxylase] ligase